MEKILNQDEIDALLKGVASGEVDTTPSAPAAPVGVVPYNFGAHERVVRGRMAALDIIHDRFMKLLAVTFGLVMHRPVDVTLKSTAVVKFGAFVGRLPVPSSLSVFKMEPLRGHALFVMDAALVYLMTDHYFGGSAQTYVKPEGRDFTPVQQRIIRNTLTAALRDLDRAWKAAHPIKAEIVRLESNPQFAMVLPSSELAVAVTFRLSVGETARDFFLCYPYSMLEPIKEKLYAGFMSDHFEVDQDWAGRLFEELHYCELEVSVELGQARVRVEDLMNFSKEDVILLDRSPGDPLVVSVEGVPKFNGTPGVSKGQQAIRVVSLVKAGA